MHVIHRIAEEQLAVKVVLRS